MDPPIHRLATSADPPARRRPAPTPRILEAQPRGTRRRTASQRRRPRAARRATFGAPAQNRLGGLVVQVELVGDLARRQVLQMAQHECCPLVRSERAECGGDVGMVLGLVVRGDQDLGSQPGQVVGTPGLAAPMVDQSSLYHGEQPRNRELVTRCQGEPATRRLERHGGQVFSLPRSSDFAPDGSGSSAPAVFDHAFRIAAPMTSIDRPDDVVRCRWSAAATRPCALACGPPASMVHGRVRAGRRSDRLHSRQRRTEVRRTAARVPG